MLDKKQIIKYKTYLMQAEINQSDIANALGYTRQYVCGILNGRVGSPIAEKKIWNYLIDVCSDKQI